MNNNNNDPDNEGNNSLDSLFQEAKNIYIQQAQPILSSQGFQQFPTYQTPNTSIPQQIIAGPIQNQNIYIYDNGAQPSTSQTSLRYPTFPNVMSDNDKLNQNNFQLRKLKKARLKRQKKAEYIDFLEQRISQLERIIKQHNLKFVEPPSEPDKKAESSNIDNNTTVLTPSSVQTPNLENTFSSINEGNDNENILKRKNNDDELGIEDSSKKTKTQIPEESKETSTCNQKTDNENKKKNNTFSIEDYRLDSSIFLQSHYLDTEISLDISKGLFEMAEDFFNIPDEFSSDFYELDKQKINFKNESLELDVFIRSNDNNQNAIPNKTNLQIDVSDPYGIFSRSFCTFHFVYKTFSETESFNDFVVEIIKALFLYCSYFPPDDLINFTLLRKDLYTHNLFMIYSLCSYGLALIPFDIPYKVGNNISFINSCIKACPAENLEDFYLKYIKNKEITYKHIFALSELFYREALKYHFFDGPIELHTIEGYISLGLFKCCLGETFKACEFLGIAVRYGDAINLNSFVDIDNNDVENIINKRLWWKCYSYDVMSVRIFDVEPLFNSTRYDKFQRDRIDYYNDKSNDVNKTDKNSTFLILHRFVRVWKKVVLFTNDILNKRLNRNYFYSVNFVKPGCSLFEKIVEDKDITDSDDKYSIDTYKDSPVLDHVHELLKMEIKNLWDSIPDAFKKITMINSSLNPNFLKLMASYHIIYYSITICIYRPSIVHKDFKWTKGYTKHSYNRTVCLKSAQRTARFIYYYMKNGIMDLIPNILIYAIFEAVAVILCDYKAEENISKKIPLKVDYKERREKILILNILIIFYYHRAKHQLLANLILKFILDYTKQNNIPTIINEIK